MLIKLAGGFMKGNLHLLIQILDLDNSDIKKIIDSGISIHELIFSDREYFERSKYFG